MTEQAFTGTRLTVARLFVGLMAVVVVAASCGNDPGDAASDDHETFADEPADEPAEEPADEPAADSAGEVADLPPSAGEGLFPLDASTDGGGLFAPEPDPDAAAARLEDNTFQDYGVRPFVDPDDDPLSTFALDVDTGSYTIARRWLTEGVLPEPESVRVEEFVNYFDYGYASPRSGLEINVDGGPSPFDEGDVLVRIGIQAAEIDDRDRGQAALTFVIDTSGSMDRDDRLALVKDSLEKLVEGLDDNDMMLRIRSVLPTGSVQAGI